MLKFTVKEDRCTGCAACVRDCPSRIIELKGAKVPFVAAGNEERCLQCQHCLAVCPTGAISVFGLDPDRSLPVSAEVLPRFEQMARLLRGRRSVRRYEDKNVDPKLIDQLLATVAHSPTGCNCRALTFTVLDDKEVLRWFRERVIVSLTEAEKAGRLPERAVFLKAAVEGWAADRTDVVFRGAPHALIISAVPEAVCGAEDVTLSLANFELLANSAGLGTVWCGILKFALEVCPELKPLIGLPIDRPYYAMLFGYPAVHYARTVQRDDAARVTRVRKS